MIKKIIILPLLFLLVHFGYIACVNCHCPEIREKYFRVENINVTLYGSNNTSIDPAIPTTTDTITLRYQFTIGCLAYQKNPFEDFVNAAYACDCGGCGYEGIKTKIRTFEITSDSVYNGIPANTSLNNVFKVKRWNFFEAFHGKTLDTVKTYVNNQYGLTTLSLFSTTKPLDAKGHKFTLTLITEDGATRSVTTNRIFWY